MKTEHKRTQFVKDWPSAPSLLPVVTWSFVVLNAITTFVHFAAINASRGDKVGFGILDASVHLCVIFILPTLMTIKAHGGFAELGFTKNLVLWFVDCPFYVLIYVAIVYLVIDYTTYTNLIISGVVFLIAAAMLIIIFDARVHDEVRTNICKHTYTDKDTNVCTRCIGRVRRYRYFRISFWA